MSLIKVYTDIGLKKPVVLLAKICKKTGKKNYHIKYLSPTDMKVNGQKVYNYENILYEIDDSSVSEYLNTDDESVIGYKRVDEGFVKVDDSDYEPSSSESDSESESESLVDEEDDEDEEDDDEEEDFSEEEE